MVVLKNAKQRRQNLLNHACTKHFNYTITMRCLVCRHGLRSYATGSMSYHFAKMHRRLASAQEFRLSDYYEDFRPQYEEQLEQIARKLFPRYFGPDSGK